jgi:acyl carrier protein
MNRNDIINKLNTIFCDVFDDNTIHVSENTTASDIEAWDSLTHITLISEVEDAFGIKFKMKEVVGMRDVGEMADIILSRLSN